ncbi:MAG: hypothetical protein RSD63_03650 [Eubacterium sp.]
MDSYAAQKIATRKFIEHKGQDFLRDNTKNMSSNYEANDDLFTMTWTLADVDSDEVLTTNMERQEKQTVTITVNMENGEVKVLEDTTVTQ